MAARPLLAVGLGADAEDAVAEAQQARAAPRARGLERGPAPGPVVLDPAAASAMSSVNMVPPR
jgi:hypothetical protein